MTATERPNRDRIVAEHAAGRLQREIAKLIGVSRKTVERHCRKLGLRPHGKRAAVCRELARQTMAATLARHGVTHLRAVNPPEARQREEAAQLAKAYGLPGDLRPIQVAVVLSLTGGGRTAAELADLLRRRRARSGYHRFNAPKVPGGNYLTDLRRRGLVALIGRHNGAGQGSGRAGGLYLLTPPAMQLLTGGITR